uniref:Uncharacterized protein n=1 Tax=Anguilla anguilla TaxID=7936 RepID=A0A0E9UJY3_ANGAN
MFLYWSSYFVFSYFS